MVPQQLKSSRPYYKSHCFASPTPELWEEREGRGRQHQRLDKRWTFSYLDSNSTNVTVSRQWQLRGIDFLSYIIPLGPRISCMPVKVYSRLYMRTSIYIPLILLLQLVSTHSLWASHHPPVVSPVMGSWLSFKAPSCVSHPSSSSAQPRI